MRLFKKKQFGKGGGTTTNQAGGPRMNQPGLSPSWAIKKKLTRKKTGLNGEVYVLDRLGAQQSEAQNLASIVLVSNQEPNCLSKN